MVCGVTNVRRARSALDSPGSSASAVSTAYWGSVAPKSPSAAVMAAFSASWARLSSHPGRSVLLAIRPSFAVSGNLI